MKISTLSVVLLQILVSCNGQTNNPPRPQAGVPSNNKQPVGGGCDGCELMYVDIPKEINPTDTSSGWTEKGQKLIVTGTVFQMDGKTAASNVILYYWQTDNNGYYSPKAGMNAANARHGHIRGWVKSDSKGKYTIYTIRPSPYPHNTIPAHIHLAIKEPDIKDEYYVDELNFDDDRLLIAYRKKYPPENRGGSGILRVLLKGDLQVAEHNIVLGLNIPNYPKKTNIEVQSGLGIGEDQPSFSPFHAYGPDKGTRTCPVCKYGRYHGILYFVGNNPNWENIKKWLIFLEHENIKRQKYLKVYFVYGNENEYSQEVRQRQLEQMGIDLGIHYVALTFVPSFSDKESEVNLNNLHSEVENTIIVYKNSNIIDKYIDLKPTADNFKTIDDLLDQTKGEYFDLPGLSYK